ncbi:hypothetical protein [Terribacillus sp. DMT04]|uniref:hypothetical protein n=1 Tax=Terribacillus sp. DMT04 TaxID=2850441 RepID=UPI001C2C21A9|nr:hypothetical protein [Terribacillus sp. DMT04]QXE03567.1 hypothetical protein KS242_17420 [Terribacillus sp. DMT04]
MSKQVVFVFNNNERRLFDWDGSLHGDITKTYQYNEGKSSEELRNDVLKIINDNTYIYFDFVKERTYTTNSILRIELVSPRQNCTISS